MNYLHLRNFKKMMFILHAIYNKKLIILNMINLLPNMLVSGNLINLHFQSGNNMASIRYKNKIKRSCKYSLVDKIDFDEDIKN